MNDDEDLKQFFGELRDADRRAMRAPDFDAVTTRLPTPDSRFPVYRIAAAIAGLAAVGLMARALLIRPEPWPDVAVASWTSPTGSLLGDPYGTTTDLFTSIVNLDTKRDST